MNKLEFVKHKVGGAARTASDLGRIGIDTFEKTADAALDSLLFYNAVGARQLRAASSLRRPSALPTFIGQSVANGADVLKRSIEDMQRGMTLVTETRIALEDLFSPVTPPEPVPAPRAKAVTRSIPV